MISSFEKYIKAAIDAKKYSVVCEMANIVHSDKNHINIMTYPGRDVRVYKNRDDEVQILCPKNISYVQESNLSKAISTGTIFDDADEVNKYAGFIVKTKMPIDAMTNKGLENPYKLREVVGSTIGVMNEDGEVDVSDADVDNGNNIIDDLLEKDSKEFKDVKNVVDDYLDNEDHEFGYDTDFTYDLQKLREEIQNFKDADISPEDSITDADWDDNWGSSSSIMGDYEDDTPDKDEDDIEVSDDDSESEDPEMAFEEYSIMMESGDMFIQEADKKFLSELKNKNNQLSKFELNRYGKTMLHYRDNGNSFTIELPPQPEKPSDKPVWEYFAMLIDQIRKYRETIIESGSVNAIKWHKYDKCIRKLFNAIGLPYKDDRVLKLLQPRPSGIRLYFMHHEYKSYEFNPETDILIHRSPKGNLTSLRPTHCSRDGVIYPRPRVYCFMRRFHNIKQLFQDMEHDNYLGDNIYVVDCNKPMTVYHDMEDGGKPYPGDGSKYSAIFINTTKPLKAIPLKQFMKDKHIINESTTYRLHNPYESVFSESYKDTEIGYKFKEECGAGCINANPSAGGNVNVAMEETEPVVPGDPNTVPKPVMSSGSDIQESDSPVETPSVTPPPMNNTAGEPNGGKKMKPENPDDLNSSPDTADTHAPVMSAVKMESFQEGFGLLRPKKLKAIDIRSIVSYVTVEMNAIKDSNDQAMLSGYVCSKLELIDFYITVLDTHDDRYVVPHSRQYLVDGQKQLSDLLTQILKIRPINRGDRVWKAIL